MAEEGKSLLSTSLVEISTESGSQRAVSRYSHEVDEGGHGQVHTLTFDALRAVALKSFEELRKAENTTSQTGKEEVSFEKVYEAIDRNLQLRADQLEFLKEFDQDGSGNLDFNEFLHIIVQVDLMGRISEQRQEEFQTSMWQWQIAKLTDTAWEAQGALQKKFEDTPDYGGIDEGSKTQWLQDMRILTETLESIWEKVDPIFFLRALRTLPEKEKIRFLDSLVFQIEMKGPEDYLKPGLGKPGETLPSRTLCPNASVYMVEVKEDGAKFPIEDDNARVPFYDTDIIDALTHGQDALPWFGYTTVNISARDLREHPEILMMIAYSGAASDVTNRLYVRGLLNRAWDDVQASFWYTIARECIFTMMLLAVPHFARRGHLPPTSLVLALLALAVATLSHQLLEVAGGLHAAMFRAQRKAGAEKTQYSFMTALSKVVGVCCLVGLLISLLLAAINTAREDEPHSKRALLTLCEYAGSIACCSIFVTWTYMLWPSDWKRVSNVLTWAGLSLILIILIVTIITDTLHHVHDMISDTDGRGIYSLILFTGAVCVSAIFYVLFKCEIFSVQEVRALKAHILVGSFWSIFEIVMAVYGVALISGFIYFGWSNGKDMNWVKDTPGNFTYEHPSWTAAYVCFKIQQVIQKTLCMRGLGENVIPAYNALFDSASTRVIMFMLLLWLNSFCTYYAFPVELVQHTFWRNLWMMAVSMYRLDLSGDFDLNDLEGLNPRIVQNGSVTDIENDTDFKPWHNAISAMYMGFFLFMNVGLLNVYIGIVSEQYTEKRKRRKEFFETYRAAHIYKIIVMRGALDEIWAACKAMIGISTNIAEARDNNGDTAIWLMYDPKNEDTRSPSNELSELERERETRKDLEQQLKDCNLKYEELQKRADKLEAECEKHRDGFWEKIQKENVELKARRK